MDKDISNKPEQGKASMYLGRGYQTVRQRLSGSPGTLKEFDEFMRCQHVVFSTMFNMMQPYLEWLRFQYWLIVFFFLVSIYYLFQPIGLGWKLVTLYFIPFYIRRLFVYPARDLLARKDVGKIVVGIIFSLMMLNMWSPIMYYVMLDIEEVSHAVVGCDGIEDHYSPGSTFLEDYHMMQGMYVRCYDSEEGSLFLATPADIDGCRRDMDCEDFAYMVIKCLAPLHNVTCVPVITTYADFKVPGDSRKSAHVGVHCHHDSEEDGHWFYLD